MSYTRTYLQQHLMGTAHSPIHVPYSTPHYTGFPDSPLSDSEDECPEDMRLPAQLGSYSLCDNRVSSTTPPCAFEPGPKVVISQPAPIASQMKQQPEDSSSDSVRQCSNQKTQAPPVKKMCSSTQGRPNLLPKS